MHLCTGGRLGDEHINAANQLLQSQFPDVQGLCTPALGQKLCFPKFITLRDMLHGHAYLQILHTGGDHWITIEILSKEEVRVYDSIFLSPTYHTLKQIASIVQSRCHQMQILLD